MIEFAFDFIFYTAVSGMVLVCGAFWAFVIGLLLEAVKGSKW